MCWTVIKPILTLSSTSCFKACVFRYDPCFFVLRPRVILLLVTMSFLTWCSFLLVTDAFLGWSHPSRFGVFWLWFSSIRLEGPERSVTCAWSWECVGAAELLWPFCRCRWNGCSLSATTAGIVISAMLLQPPFFTTTCACPHSSLMALLRYEKALSPESDLLQHSFKKKKKKRSN